MRSLNEVFHWDPVEDKFIYSGKSYILERIRLMLDMSKTEMRQETERRIEILKWMHKNDTRAFEDVAKIVASYTETPDQLIKMIRKKPKKSAEKKEPILRKEEDFADDKASEVDVDMKYNIAPTGDGDVNIRTVPEENNSKKDIKPNGKKMKQIYNFLSKRKMK